MLCVHGENKMFAFMNSGESLYEDACLRWMSITWKPWSLKSSSGTSGAAALSDLVDSILDTYLHMLPAPRYHGSPKRPSLSEVAACVRLIADMKSAGTPNGPDGHLDHRLEESFYNCHESLETLLPGAEALRGDNVQVVAAYVALLMKDFAMASKIPFLTLESPSFLPMAMQLLGGGPNGSNGGPNGSNGPYSGPNNTIAKVLTALVEERQRLPAPDDDHKYVSLEYWLVNMNVPADDVQAVEAAVQAAAERTRLINVRARCVVTSVPDEVTGVYKVAFIV